MSPRLQPACTVNTRIEPVRACRNLPGGPIMSESGSLAATALGIIEHMRRVAPPGQPHLDHHTLRQLADLTRDLIAATQGASRDAMETRGEHARFAGIRGRELTLPEDDLASRLNGATVLVTG